MKGDFLSKRYAAKPSDSDMDRLWAAERAYRRAGDRLLIVQELIEAKCELAYYKAEYMELLDSAVKSANSDMGLAIVLALQSTGGAK